VYKACPVCDHKQKIELIGIEGMPIYCNILLESKEKALSANLGNIDLVVCPNCSHIYNQTFDPGKMDYDVEYENSLHYSATFTDFTNVLAEKLVSTHNLHGKNIVEIGCGKGDFLEAICSVGGNQGYGFDRSFDKNRFDKTAYPHVNFYQEFYGPEHANIPLDFLCCRHVLEHIEFPAKFIDEIQNISSNFENAGIYFEVPNGLFTLRDFGIWDIIYEHCSYFTPHSLSYVFNKNGLKITNIEETFNAQFISLEAVTPKGETVDAQALQSCDRERIVALTSTFNNSYQNLHASWLNKLHKYKDQDLTAVIWGAGSKGITFLNIFKSQSQIQYAVDLNPHKHGKFAPGSGQEIIAPENLVDVRPDVIIVMNEVYHDEISETVSNMGLEAKIETV